MTDTTQIVGVATIVFFMIMALYAIDVKEDNRKSAWLMCVALLVGMVMF